MSNSVEKANRLPFYKAPQPKANLYQFTKKDIENSRVVKRFEMRPAPPPPTTISPSSSNSQVTEGGRANEAGIKLGDSIVKINDTDTKTMSLSEAHQRIQNAGGDIKLTVKKYTPILQLPIRKFIQMNRFWFHSFEEDESKINEEHEIELARKNKKEIDRGKFFF